MIKLSVITYYFHTVRSLFLYTSWWKIPYLALKKPFIYSIPLGLRFYISNFMDIWTLQEVIIDQHYERFSHIRKNGVVIDIGGSVGDFSIFASKIREASKVHTYELNPERIQLFKKNVELNHARSITLHEKPALSLVKVLEECKITNCDFMKVDCEGAEYKIFSKVPISTLRKIRSINFEVHFFTPEMITDYEKLKKLLLSADFRLIELSNPVHNTIGFLYALRN